MKIHTSTSVYRFGILAISALLMMPMGLSAADNRYNLLTAADPDTNRQYVRAAFGQVQNKAFDTKSAKKKLLLIGDSQAQDFLNTALSNHYLANYQVRTRHIPAQCQPYFGDASASGIASKDQALCDSVDSLAKVKPQIEHADVIIIAALWRDWAVKQLPTTIENLALRENQTLVVLGRKSFGRISLRHYLRMSEGKRVSLRNPINDAFLKDNNVLAASLPNNMFVNQYALICGLGQKACPVFTPAGELISFDGGHLTKEGARFVGERIFASEALSALVTAK